MNMTTSRYTDEDIQLLNCQIDSQNKMFAILNITSDVFGFLSSIKLAT